MIVGSRFGYDPTEAGNSRLVTTVSGHVIREPKGRFRVPACTLTHALDSIA